MSSKHLILLAEDEEALGTIIKESLETRNFDVIYCSDGVQAKEQYNMRRPDILVLDVMMPGEDGVSLTKHIRETRQTPILLLTAKGEIEDRIVGLEAGADDYLAKPFEPKELLLRINAILRRVPEPKISQLTPTILHLGICRYDISRGELWQGDQLVRLTGTEQELMKIFAGSVNEPVSRAQLVSELGRDGSQAQDRAIDVQITRLRRKLEANPKEPRYLQTVRGAGYMLIND